MADPWTDISYYAASRASCERANETSLGGGFQYGLASGPSGSFTLQSARQTDTQGWVPNQAWLESLRYYPPEEEDVEFANTGCTHGRQVPHHLENGVRLRSGLAAADPEWRASQLQECWAPESAHRHGLRFDNIQPAILPPPAPVTAQGRIATGSFRHTGSYDDDDSALPSADEPLSYSSRWDSPSARKEVSKEAWSGRAYDRAQGLPTSTCMSVLQKADSQQWRGLPPGEAQSQVEAVGTNTHTNDANINDARRPRHRMMVLAAPKRRTSQDHHLHEWEIKSRKKDYAHLPIADKRRSLKAATKEARVRADGSRRSSKQQTAGGDSTTGSVFAKRGESYLLKPLWQLYGELVNGSGSQSEETHEVRI